MLDASNFQTKLIALTAIVMLNFESAICINLQLPSFKLFCAKKFLLTIRLLSHFVFSVVDGDDMTRYDDMKITGGITPRIGGGIGGAAVDGDMEDDDEEIAMNDLELELASQTGRLTGQYG